ncbi:protein of unknown function (plasmid) [Lactiplantibacillus plantarum]
MDRPFYYTIFNVINVCSILKKCVQE